MSRTVIIGGVAGGATAAARLRRLNEQMEILLIERGQNISYANCGLPYYIGDVIRERGALLVQTEKIMRDRFRIDVRTGQEALKIDPIEKKVVIRGRDGACYEERYDDLVLATGSSPLKPPIPGIGSEGIYTLWTVEDTDRIRAIVDSEGTATAAVIGGGFIGLEMAENLHRRGIRVSVVEARDQVMAPLDPEMAALLHGRLRENGVELHLGDGVKAFERTESGVRVTLASGKTLDADIVILSIGVRPNSALAREAGLQLNERGGIVVDERQRTSDPDIWAVGDVAQVVDRVTGLEAMIPLAGPANKQGRIAADNIAAKYDRRLRGSAYHGSLGTSIAQVFDRDVASVGVNEKSLIASGREKGRDYETVLISQRSHAGYYPGAAGMFLKLIFDRSGRIWGAQIVGRDGVDKRIDTIAVTMRLGGTVRDLSELELAYAPPFSSAKDPVNMAGFTAGNVLDGLVRFRTVKEVREGLENGSLYVLDVRENVEREAWALPGSLHIPMGELRGRLGELPRDREICVLCAAGVRAYSAARILNGSGFDDVTVLEGGAGFYRAVTAGSR